MNAFTYIIIIIVIVLIAMVIYDSRHSILSFFKQKFYKPKEFKIPKVKENPKQDPDEMPNEGRVNYGEFNMEKASKTSDDTVFTMDSIFEQEEVNKNDLDVDQMYEDLRREEAKKMQHNYQSDSLDEEIPDFDNMSIDDLDDFLQNNFDDKTPNINSFEGLNDSMSGEELGKAVKNLPRPLKVLIASDILKRKDW